MANQVFAQEPKSCLSNTENSCNKEKSGLDDLNNYLFENFPNRQEYNIPDEQSVNKVSQLIESYNSKAEQTLEAARLAVIRSYVDNEKQRVIRQKPLLIVITILASVQLVAFNVMIFVILDFSFNTGNLEIINQMLNLFKYYIGATIVELIGLLVVITKGTFSSNHVKIMRLLLGSNYKDSIVDVNKLNSIK